MFKHLIFVVIFTAFLSIPILGKGRRPQTIEHNFCSLMFAEDLYKSREIDKLAIAQAYNVGQNGSPCVTTCRILSRGNVKPLEPLPSPDFIVCGRGNKFCYKGECISEKDLVVLLKNNKKRQD